MAGPVPGSAAAAVTPSGCRWPTGTDRGPTPPWVCRGWTAAAAVVGVGAVSFGGVVVMAGPVPGSAAAAVTPSGCRWPTGTDRGPTPPWVCRGWTAAAARLYARTPALKLSRHTAGEALTTPGERSPATYSGHRYVVTMWSPPTTVQVRDLSEPKRENHADLRGHQPDPAPGDRPRPRRGLSAPIAKCGLLAVIHPGMTAKSGSPVVPVGAC
jgi:hypothetical protein